LNALYVLLAAVIAGVLVIAGGSTLFKMPELAWAIGRRA
jgi:outer membrane murein-binding lipoprotein Lpp